MQETDEVDAHALLTGLVGKTISTLTGRPNKILTVERTQVLVGTSRSPRGEWVPLSWVQDALDRLVREGEVEISVASVGYRSAFVGAVLASVPGTVATTGPSRVALNRVTAPAISPVADTVETLLTDEQNLVDPTVACAEIHALLSLLPFFRDPPGARTSVLFSNGLYFFYEEGESDAHGGGGRITRIGNHPKKADGLHDRLDMHYNSRVGAKNFSVFRRYVGGALLRNRDPGSTCLALGPGKGHWEHQGDRSCERCSPYEKQVTDALGARFSFRLVAVPERVERKRFEDLLIATVAACKECKASQQWLGHHAYSETVQTSGLWNKQGVGGRTATLEDIQRFEELVMGSSFR